MKKLLLTALSLFLVSASSAQVPKSGLQACFRFNGNTDDVSGNGKNAIVNGTGVTLTTDRSNNSNSAYYFDGTDGDISANIGEFKDELTISFWYEAATQPQPYPHFFDYGDYKVRCHIMSGSIYNSTDRNGIFLEASNPSATEIRGSQKPGDNKWTHVIVTVSKSANEMKLYVNGMLDKKVSIPSNSLDLTDGIIVFGKVRTGAPSTIATTRFKGKLDDIFIYDRVVNDTEIAALFNGDDVASVKSINKNELSVYPNPFNNTLNVSTNYDHKDITYQIIDITGKMVLEAKNTSTINTEHLKEGVYFLSTCSSNAIIETRKIIKQ